MASTYRTRFLVRRDTTARWNAQTGFIPMKGEIIVYTDHAVTQDENGNDVLVPGVKIGDGNAYCVDLPFITDPYSRQNVLDELRRHEANTAIHTSEEEKDFWDSKLNCDIEGETLMLTRN